MQIGNLIGPFDRSLLKNILLQCVATYTNNTTIPFELLLPPELRQAALPHLRMIQKLALAPGDYESELAAQVFAVYLADRIVVGEIRRQNFLAVSGAVFTLTNNTEILIYGFNIQYGELVVVGHLPSPRMHRVVSFLETLTMMFGI